MRPKTTAAAIPSLVSDVTTDQMEISLDDAEQAKGVLSERAQINIDAASEHLRTYARQHNHRLSDVAAEVIDGRLTASAVISAPQQPA